MLIVLYQADEASVLGEVSSAVLSPLIALEEESQYVLFGQLYLRQYKLLCLQTFHMEMPFGVALKYTMLTWSRSVQYCTIINPVKSFLDPHLNLYLFVHVGKVCS